jgi:SAM-dependent methyltransferase
MLEATAAAEERHFWFRGLRRFARRLLEGHLHPSTEMLIVDCGAGTGRNLDWLGEFGTAVGIELNPVGLSLGQRRGRRLVRGSVAALPIADRTATLATSFDVLYCLDDETEHRALREMTRILKPGGLALFNVAALDILHGSHSTLTHEVRRYTPERLSSRLTAAGLHVERMTFTNLTPFPFALAVRGLERLSGRAAEASTNDLAVPATPVNAIFDAALTCEAALLNLTNLPIGTSLMALARKPGSDPGV